MPDHGRDLKAKIEQVSRDWITYLEEYNDGDATGSAALSYVPLYLQIDPNMLEEDTLRGWGIDVVAVEPGGYILGVATSADYPKLRAKLNTMISGSMAGVKQMAYVWDISSRGASIDSIVKDEQLLGRWGTIEDEREIWIEVDVSLDKPFPRKPEEATKRQENAWQKEAEAWFKHKDACVAELERLVKKYEGEEISQIDQNDTVTYKLKVSGVCLKQLVFVPHVFAIVEYDLGAELIEREDASFGEVSVTVVPPSPNAPRVCVIDSGMQTRHPLLGAAVEHSASRNYVPGESATAVADLVRTGGHGTRVAGAVLYSSDIPADGTTVQPIAWLQNARILNRGNVMNQRLFPPALMRKIVSDYSGTRLFNLSVQSQKPCLTTHMSAWAAEIDKLSFENDVLFITSAGNVSSNDPLSFRLGIKQHMDAGRPYPIYLAEASCRIGNPAQSCQALTVGSVCTDRLSSSTHTSFGERNMPSAFSRTGLGMWNMIKPDVVEYGGDFALSISGDLTPHDDVSPELVTSTMYGLPIVTRKAVGTSFAAPKVAHIAAALAAAFPSYSTQLYRALIVQSAQWPAALDSDPYETKLFHLRTLGYGVPDKSKCLENTDSRITFIKEGRLAKSNAHIYEVQLDRLNGLADDTLYRIEVTLAYAARPRRTRQTMSKYVSTRLKWQMADLGQSLSSFLATVDVTLAPDSDLRDSEVNDGSTPDTVQWEIGAAVNRGVISHTVSRLGSTLQKDWTVVEGFKLYRERLLFAVTGHEGWDKKSGEDVPYAFVVSITSLAGVPIYERLSVANLEVEV
ncbi:S8 family peptidase [Hymenobacter sp. BT523]|uniref:S8 family peptidase n=1 Tax=Hymenobacter sp. BT523 TaxID=2795725 RepID=UPI0018ED7A49|nr:S8 family peptidase [Hymenobacter sp. BT523]MBJ6107652.1 S8 family peptidase [Hymenobacter sp. BT523]